MQGFAHVDIAKASNEPLVQQRRFQGRAFTCERLRQHLAVHEIAQRLDAKVSKKRMLLEIGSRRDVHEAKAPGIVINDARARREMKDNVIVRGVLGPVVVEGAGHQRLVSLDAKRSTHAQMHDQRGAIIEVADQVLGPTPQRIDAPACQASLEISRKREAQIRAPLLHGDNRRSAHGGIESPANSLDFWKFRHVSQMWRCHMDRREASHYIAIARHRRYGPPPPEMNMPTNQHHDTPAPEADFGYRKVRLEQKQGLVNDVFHAVASRYDLMNDLMSAGLHRPWKDHLVSMVNPSHTRPFRHLDVAGGTGDVAFRVAEAGGPATQVTVADINAAMLQVGRERAERLRLDDRVEFAEINAESLPFPDNHFDAYTIAFGIRNVPRRELALREARRVLKRGGRFLCLEFSDVDVPVLDAIYRAYSFTVIPAVGKAVTGDGEPYRYLVESIARFPTADAFRDEVTAAGFQRSDFTKLTGGVVAIHSGWKL